MTRQDDDREGPKPYKTYKARRPRRSQVDEELAGARPVRERSAADAGAPADTRQDDRAYRTYGAAPDDERKGGGRRKKKAADPGPRRRRRFRWWYVPVGVFAVLAIAGVALTVLAWPGYQKFDRAVDKANKRVDKQTRAQLAADDGWIWRNGTTVLLFGLDEAGLPAHSDTIMLMHFDPKTHAINQLSIPRDTLVNVDGYGQSKITQAMWYGGPSLALKTVKDYTGIPINHVMVVGFQGFPRLVNAVGGIDMNVPQTVTTGAGPGVAGSTQRVVTFEKGPAPLRRQGRHAVRAHPQGLCGGRLHARRTPAGVSPGASEEAHAAGQPHQAAGDRQALHERRRHRPHHQLRSSSSRTSSGVPPAARSR